MKQNKMQIANCLVSLGGDTGNQVMKFATTAAEIAVLRAIHGDESVSDIEPIGTVDRSNRAERERLIAVYGAAKNAAQQSIVGTMFPGVAARVYEHLDELELDETFFKPTGHVSSNANSDQRPLDRPVPAPDGEASAFDAPVSDDVEEDDGKGGVGEINDEFSKPTADNEAPKENLFG